MPEDKEGTHATHSPVFETYLSYDTSLPKLVIPTVRRTPIKGKPYNPYHIDGNWLTVKQGQPKSDPRILIEHTANSASSPGLPIEHHTTDLIIQLYLWKFFRDPSAIYANMSGALFDKSIIDLVTAESDMSFWPQIRTQLLKFCPSIELAPEGLTFGHDFQLAGDKLSLDSGIYGEVHTLKPESVWQGMYPNFIRLIRTPYWHQIEVTNSMTVSLYNPHSNIELNQLLQNPDPYDNGPTLINGLRLATFYFSDLYGILYTYAREGELDARNLTKFIQPYIRVERLPGS